MHKNKYDHNILLNDIQKLDKIQHKHSLVAIQFPDTSAEKKSGWSREISGGNSSSMYGCI